MWCLHYCRCTVPATPPVLRRLEWPGGFLLGAVTFVTSYHSREGPKDHQRMTWGLDVAEPLLRVFYHELRDTLYSIPGVWWTEATHDTRMAYHR